MDRRSIRRKKQLRKYVCGIVAGVLLAAVLFYMENAVKCGAAQQKNQRNAITTVSDEINKIRQIEEKLQQLAASDPYGARLAELYKRDMKAGEIILNRQQYPDHLMEYLVTHPEAVEWVAGYPEKMAQGTEAIDQAALAATNLADYQVRNGIPVYYQWGQAWGYASYGRGCIAMDGCGPTCLSMVATGLKGDTGLTPKRVADLAVQSGFYQDGSGSSWDLMTDGARMLGVNVREVEWSLSALKAELMAGHPVICSMGPGDFTTQGHFIVLAGLAEDGKAIVNDPNSRINTEKTWDLQVLLNQMKSMWVYG